VQRRRDPGPICSRQTKSDRMPQARLDRDQCATRSQKSGGLGEAWAERALKGDVVKDESVEDDVE
jgi:hypothetical protein